MLVPEQFIEHLHLARLNPSFGVKPTEKFQLLALLMVDWWRSARIFKIKSTSTIF